MKNIMMFSEFTPNIHSPRFNKFMDSKYSDAELKKKLNNFNGQLEDLLKKRNMFPSHDYENDIEELQIKIEQIRYVLKKK